MHKKELAVGKVFLPDFYNLGLIVSFTKFVVDNLI
jgi:hypothetical protein